MRGKSERIERIQLAEILGLSCWNTEKEILLPIIQLWERKHYHKNCQFEIDHVTQLTGFSCYNTKWAPKLAFIPSLFWKKSLFSYSADKNRFDSDLAILKLDSPLVFDDKVKPICLPDVSFEPGTVKGVVSGWGDTIAGTLFLY